MHSELIERYREALGYDPPSWPKEAKGAKLILDMGYTVDDAIRCYEHYKSRPFWKDKHLSLTYIASNISAWIQENPSTDFSDDLDKWFRENNDLESW